jgi:putative ABC transport system permease protein
MVMIGQWDPKKYLEMNRRNPQLTREEYDFIRTHTKLVRAIGMQATRGSAVHRGNTRMEEVNLMGVSANMGVISNVVVDTGRFFTESDDARRLPVAFIGYDVKERLFGPSDPIGKTVAVQGRPFEVIGTARQQGSVFGQSRDSFVMIPVETYFKMNGSRLGIGFAALAMDRNHLEQAQDEVRVLLRAVRGQKPNEEDTFGVVSSDSLVAAWDRMTGAIAATAVGVVSVFMVVGGVVIMNIMLAVVTERTREIGIRRSTGATRGDILRQFLVESSLLSAAGGLIGVGIAWLAAILVRNLTPVPMAMPPTAIFLGVGLSAIAGLFFGIYPARRAAQLDPIEALRAET